MKDRSFRFAQLFTGILATAMFGLCAWAIITLVRSIAAKLAR